MHHPDPGLIFAPGEQPDKVLFQKATNEISHGRYDVGRLTLQTLINTYPDSEYLSKAKLAIANSYYSEGGVSGLTQAESEYKDFITFFPTAPEAPEAQYRVGMAHFRLMAKADRDQTEAKVADAEFKEFLLKYPDSPLVSRVKRRLRQTQEVVAEGEYFTANFYYLHGDYRASRSRFQEIVDKYPDFSAGDEALYYLGQSLEHLHRGREAIPYYSHVITDFPLSPLIPQAKERLTAMKQPIPRADSRDGGASAGGCQSSGGPRLVIQTRGDDVRCTGHGEDTLWSGASGFYRQRDGERQDAECACQQCRHRGHAGEREGIDDREARRGGREFRQCEREGQGQRE